MNIIKLENKYLRSLSNQYKKLIALYDDIKSEVHVSLKKRDITKAILLRMKAYYETQNKIKEFLNKRYVSAASDFFVESILFYLKLILDIKNKNFEVHSERKIKPKRGTIRPDITVWKKDKVIVIIECKTQFGWNRYGWEEDFKKRELKLNEEFPNAKAFLVIMTSENWPGIPDNNKNVGEKYFTLSNIRPTNISPNNLDSVIINPIENLFKKILLS